MKYQFVANDNAPFGNKEAQKIGEELHALVTQGNLTADNIVSVASDPKSAMHPYFEWDDKAAADEYRRRQANWLVKNLSVIDCSIGGQAQTHPFVSVFVEKAVIQHRKAITPSAKAEAQTFVAVTEVRESPNLRKEALTRAIHEARKWRDKYAGLGLEELQPVFEAIDRYAK